MLYFNAPDTKIIKISFICSAKVAKLQMAAIVPTIHRQCCPCPEPFRDIAEIKTRTL